MQKIKEVTETGCYLDNHRGHYIIRDAILLAIDFGFSVSFEDARVIERYDADHWNEDYPFETIVELADEARDWLNGDKPSGAGFLPPTIPTGTTWDWNDGDFGLYHFDEDGEICNPPEVCGGTGNHDFQPIDDCDECGGAEADQR